MRVVFAQRRARIVGAAIFVFVGALFIGGGIQSDASDEFVEYVRTSTSEEAHTQQNNAALAGLIFVQSSQARPVADATDDPVTGGPYEDGYPFEFQTVGGSALVASIPPTISIISRDQISSERGSDILTYEVAPGDSLSSIAADFDVTLETLLWANNLTSRSTLQPGDVIEILPVSGVHHTVARGETIGGIAQQYRVPSGEILAFNNIGETDVIRVGQTLIIPGGRPHAPVRSQTASQGPVYSLPASSDGYFVRPAQGRRTQGLHPHNAVDIGGRNFCNTPIYAAAAGTVIEVRNQGWNGGYGRFIKISHSNGTVTLYAHNSQNLVSHGERVGQGDVIALMGATGRTTGCHVHFEVRGARNPFAG